MNYGAGLGNKAMASKSFFCTYVSEIMANGRNKALADMVTRWME